MKLAKLPFRNRPITDIAPTGVVRHRRDQVRNAATTPELWTMPLGAGHDEQVSSADRASVPSCVFLSAQLNVLLSASVIVFLPGSVDRLNNNL